MNVTNEIKWLGLEGNENVGLICTCMMEEALASSVLVKVIDISRISYYQIDDF